MSTEPEHKEDEASHCSTCEHGHDETSLPRNALVITSGVLLGVGLLLQWLKIEPSWLSTVTFALSTLAGGLLVVPAAFGALKKLRLDMNVLMTVAVAGAWLIGEPAEAASVVFLFALSELLESWSVGRARQAIKSLLQLTPETATLKEAGAKSKQVPVAEIKPDDIILVRSGDRVPLDGVILTGASAINQAPITGESIPVEKKGGDSGTYHHFGGRGRAAKSAYPKIRR